MNITGTGILDYARGVGGRIFDLPRGYQDTVAAVVRTLHPKTITREMQLLMASDGYLGSSHPLIRGLDVDELHEFHRKLAGKAVTDGTG